MPFGLTNAPAVFQALINDILRDRINRFVFVYLDGMLIFSQFPSEHEQHVRQGLQCLLENKLYVKAEKCKYHVSSVFPGVRNCTRTCADRPHQGLCRVQMANSH